ncbi:MAG: ParB N-terminal domain-containing protein [Saprospiraceae bacterium]|nr:ParB N-terminal domain-containing protein [Saprospiraceae bacterium]
MSTHLREAWRVIAIPEPWRSGYDAPYTELVPIRYLIDIMEVDREGSPRLDALTEDISQNGFTDPVIIEVRPYEDMDSRWAKVLLIEGNHRLAAGIRLLMTHIPAKVLPYDSFRDQGVGLSSPVLMELKVTFRDAWEGSGFKKPSQVFNWTGIRS